VQARSCQAIDPGGAVPDGSCAARLYNIQDVLAIAFEIALRILDRNGVKHLAHVSPTHAAAAQRVAQPRLSANGSDAAQRALKQRCVLLCAASTPRLTIRERKGHEDTSGHEKRLCDMISSRPVKVLDALELRLCATSRPDAETSAEPRRAPFSCPPPPLAPSPMAVATS